METSEISLFEIQVYQFLKQNKDTWVSNSDIMKHTHLVPRTVRQKTRKLVDLGLVDEAEVFPGHLFRMSGMAGKRNLAYLKRLEQTIAIMGERFFK